MPSIGDAQRFFIETGAMQGEKRYILEFSENLAEFFDEKSGHDTTIDIQHQGYLWPNQDFKFHDADHYTPQWRVFLPTAFSQFSPTYYPDRVAKFEKEEEEDGNQYYDLTIRRPTHDDVEAWRSRASREGVLDSTGQGGRGREYGFY
jgi:hypothetical protein